MQNGSKNRERTLGVVTPPRQPDRHDGRMALLSASLIIDFVASVWQAASSKLGDRKES